MPAYLGSLLLVHYFRASRWRFLIAPVQRVPMRDVILLNWIGFFAIFALPLRLGELARPALTKLRHGISISVGLGTIAVERVIDGLITSLCVAVALLVLPRVPTQRPGRRAPADLRLRRAAAVRCRVHRARDVPVAARAGDAADARRRSGLLAPALAEKLSEKVGKVADGLRSIGDVRLIAGFLLESLLYWGCNAVGVWLLARGCGLPVNLGHAAAIMGVLAIGILLPTGPGLFGNFQLAVSAALRLYFAESIVGAQGAVFIFLLYALQSSVMVRGGHHPALRAQAALPRPGVAAADSRRAKLSRAPKSWPPRLHGASISGDASSLGFGFAWALALLLCADGAQARRESTYQYPYSRVWTARAAHGARRLRQPHHRKGP